MVKIIQQFIQYGVDKRRSKRPLNPKYITIHSTANPASTAKNEADNVCKNHTTKNAQGQIVPASASFHYVVGPDVIYQVLPISEVAWHAGDGTKRGGGNMTSIGIEMVETGDRETVVKNTVELVLELMKQYKIPFGNIVRHYDWTKKLCPQIFMRKELVKGGIDWNVFRAWLMEPEKEDEMVKRYNKVSELPKDLQREAQELVASGALAGGSIGLDVTEDMIRTMIISKRYADKIAKEVK